MPISTSAKLLKKTALALSIGSAIAFGNIMADTNKETYKQFNTAESRQQAAELFLSLQGLSLWEDTSVFKKRYKELRKKFTKLPLINERNIGKARVEFYSFSHIAAQNYALALRQNGYDRDAALATLKTDERALISKVNMSVIQNTVSRRKIQQLSTANKVWADQGGKATLYTQWPTSNNIRGRQQLITQEYQFNSHSPGEIMVATAMYKAGVPLTKAHWKIRANQWKLEQARLADEKAYQKKLERLRTQTESFGFSPLLTGAPPIPSSLSDTTHRRSDMSYGKALSIFGLDSSATPGDIKAQYRNLARHYHPDSIHGYTPEEMERMVQINLAMERLKKGADADDYDADAEELHLISSEASGPVPTVEPALSKSALIAQDSPTGAQVKSLYGAGISEIQANLATSGMYRHSSVMQSIHSGRALAGVTELKDFSTGEMLASNDSARINRDQVSIKTGHIYSYGQAYGLKVSQDSLSHLPGFDANGYGLEIGVFRQMSEAWSLGIMMGFQNINSSFKDDVGSMKANNYRFGPFASWNSGPWHFNTALTYGWSDLEGKRQDLYTGEQRSSTPRVKEWNAYASLGYDIPLDNIARGLVLTPNIELLYINSTQDGFKEKGQGDGLIQVESASHQDWIARTGVQATYLIPDYERPQELRLSVGYQKNFMENHDIKAGHSSGTIQPLKTGRYGNHSVYYNLGYSVMFNGDQSLHFDYFGSTGNSSQSHALAATYEMKF